MFISFGPNLSSQEFDSNREGDDKFVHRCCPEVHPNPIRRVLDPEGQPLNCTEKSDLRILFYYIKFKVIVDTTKCDFLDQI